MTTDQAFEPAIRVQETFEKSFKDLTNSGASTST